MTMKMKLKKHLTLNIQMFHRSNLNHKQMSVCQLILGLQEKNLYQNHPKAKK